MSLITVIIPALNENKGIAKTIKSVPKEELATRGHEVQILVVDNGSDDGTAEAALEAGAEVIHEPRRGYGYAYKAGFSNAKGDIITTTDADMTYPISMIPELVNILEAENLDFITTDRLTYLENGAMSSRNKMGNRILAIAANSLFQLNMKDPESGMWVFRKNILDKMRLGSNSWPFSHEIKIEACYYNKCRWREIPIKYHIRMGETKLLDGWKIGFDDLVHIIKKRVVR